MLVKFRPSERITHRRVGNRRRYVVHARSHALDGRLSIGEIQAALERNLPALILVDIADDELQCPRYMSGAPHCAVFACQPGSHFRH